MIVMTTRYVGLAWIVGVDLAFVAPSKKTRTKGLGQRGETEVDRGQDIEDLVSSGFQYMRLDQCLLDYRSRW